MKKYTQPTAKVVELSVRESLSWTSETKPRTFGFGSYTKNASVTNFAAAGVSELKTKKVSG